MRTLRFAHRWLGLLLALPLLLQGVTGGVLALAPIVDWFGDGGAAVEVVSADAIVAAALAAGPPGARAARYQPPEAAGDPARVMLLPPGQRRGPGLFVRVDPATATALGPATAEAGALPWIKRFHENWLIPQWGGRQIAGWLGVGLLTLLLLGIPLWWPRNGWRAGFTVPLGARGPRLQRALHGAMGGWFALLLLITGGTGVVEGFPQTARAAFGAAEGQRFPPGGGRSDAAPGQPPRLDAALTAAKEAAPGLVLRFAILPAGPEPMRLIMGPPGGTGASTGTTVTVDPKRAPSVTLQPPEQRSAPERLLAVMRDLHAGDGFGPVWRGLASFSSILLPAFGVTGFLLWWLKRSNRRRAKAAWDPAGRDDMAGVQ